MSFLEKIKNDLPNNNDDLEKDLEATIPTRKKSTRVRKIKAETEKVPLKKQIKGKEEDLLSNVPRSQKEEKKWPEKEGQLAVDVYQTDGELVIQTAIAGVKPEDLDITVQGDVVIIKGRREKANQEEGVNYFYQECYWGAFSREIILPVEADSARAQASMTDGILTIRIPKIVKEGIKKIAVT